MCLGTKGDFFGGYDHKAAAGIVHLANHHIAPGKKQWTWGNHAFGYAWDRNLTEPDDEGVYRPYIELMAGAYTDNQPDFSFLAPGETKDFRQFWYPIQAIGTVQQANLAAALHLSINSGVIRIGVAAPTPVTDAAIILETDEGIIGRWERSLRPDAPFTQTLALPAGVPGTDLRLRVCDATGMEMIAIDQSRPAPQRPRPRPSRPNRLTSRASTNSTSPGCTSSSIAMQRGRRTTTGARRSGATRWTAAATTRWVYGASDAANSLRRSRIFAERCSVCSDAIPILMTARRFIISA